MGPLRLHIRVMSRPANRSSSCFASAHHEPAVSSETVCTLPRWWQGRQRPCYGGSHHTNSETRIPPRPTSSELRVGRGTAPHSPSRSLPVGRASSSAFSPSIVMLRSIFLLFAILLGVAASRPIVDGAIAEDGADRLASSSVATRSTALRRLATRRGRCCASFIGGTTFPVAWMRTNSPSCH